MKEDALAKKVQDLEFLLRREKMESKTRVKEILHQMLEMQESLNRLIQIGLKQNFPSEVNQFISERFGLIGKKILQEVERAGGVQINSIGLPYNEEYHEVLDFVYNPDLPEGQVVRVEQEGYLLAGEVLRMAKVIVSKTQK